MTPEPTTRSVTIEYVEVYSVYSKGRPQPQWSQDLPAVFRTYEEAFESAAKSGIEAFNVGKQFVRSDVAASYFVEAAQ